MVFYVSMSLRLHPIVPNGTHTVVQYNSIHLYSQSPNLFAEYPYWGIYTPLDLHRGQFAIRTIFGAILISDNIDDENHNNCILK